MAVDQAGKDEGAAQIDHFSVADEAVADFDDLVPSDHESFIAQDATAGGIGQKPPDLDERGRLFRRNDSDRRGLPRLRRGGGQNGSGHNQSQFLHRSLPELRAAP
ncbi:hypothetical protein D3C86_1667500 [compost metagenome]